MSYVNRGRNIGHYTPVLPILLLRRGRDISQGNFKNCGTLKISTPNVPRFLQKKGDIEKQYSQCPTFYEIIFYNYKSIKPT